MALFKLKTASFILIEDDYNKNLVPLITELIQDNNTINMLCYEYPASFVTNVFKNNNVVLLDNSNLLDVINTSEKSIVVIDSINQLALNLGWDKCLRYLKRLSSLPHILKVILILHTDCLLPGSKIQAYLNHIANAIVSYDTINPCKIKVQVKTGGKLFKSEEMLSYDYRTGVLNSKPILKPTKKEEVVEKPLPSDMSTFKIEVDQLNQLAKHQLKLPYMSKINEGKGKVYYEPDAVDDWDDEDPDDDLDI